MGTLFIITAIAAPLVITATIGLILIGFAKITEPIERRRAEKARREWVEKYGESGRGDPRSPRQNSATNRSDNQAGCELTWVVKEFNEETREILDNGDANTIWGLKDTIIAATQHLELGKSVAKRSGEEWQTEPDVASKIKDLEKKLANLEEEKRQRTERLSLMDPNQKPTYQLAWDSITRQDTTAEDPLPDKKEISKQKRQVNNITRQSTPPEDPRKFELYCANLLTKCGFDNAKTTKQSGDQGIDVIAVKDGVKYGIQCKRYSSDVGNKAVQEAYAGKAFYGCHVAVVMTNSGFTTSAVELAEQLGVVLWDGKHIAKLASNANKLSPRNAEDGRSDKAHGNCDELITLARKAGIKTIDNRNIGGCLWIVGGKEIEGTLHSWGEAAKGLTFKPDGGRATAGKDAWWIR